MFTIILNLGFFRPDAQEWRLFNIWLWKKNVLHIVFYAIQTAHKSEEVKAFFPYLAPAHGDYKKNTHSVQQEADVALDHLNHSINVHHRLLVPSAQIGAHLCVEVLQLKHACKHDNQIVMKT